MVEVAKIVVHEANEPDFVGDLFNVVYDAANLSYDPKHHDPRGRVYYVKAEYGF